VHFPVLLPVRASPRLRALSAFIHLSAFGAALLLPWPLLLRLLLVAALAVSFFQSWRAPELREIHLGEEGDLSCRFADGRSASAVLLPGTRLFSFGVLLAARCEDPAENPATPPRVCRVPLLADSLPPEGLRQLRLWLRWKYAGEKN